MFSKITKHEDYYEHAKTSSEELRKLLSYNLKVRIHITIIIIT